MISNESINFNNDDTQNLHHNRHNYGHYPASHRHRPRDTPSPTDSISENLNFKTVEDQPNPVPAQNYYNYNYSSSSGDFDRTQTQSPGRIYQQPQQQQYQYQQHQQQQQQYQYHQQHQQHQQQYQQYYQQPQYSTIQYVTNLPNLNQNIGYSNEARVATPTRLEQTGSYESNVEREIIGSTSPVSVHETEEINVLGQRGIYMNKSEVQGWSRASQVPIGDYPINNDPQPQVIHKRPKQMVNYIQEMAVRYLQPPTPEPPGDIVIRQEANVQTAPAPPLIIRQQPPRAPTPEPIIIREKPPEPPKPVGPKVITISGKVLPPPPRKVIVERLAPMPPRPPSIILERWLPYPKMKRRVIYEKAAQRECVLPKPKNVVIEWEQPEVEIEREYKHLGVSEVDPNEYKRRYGTNLVDPNKLPDFLKNIKPPSLASIKDRDKRSSYAASSGSSSPASSSVYDDDDELPVLEGDIEALALVDLDQYGLSDYKYELDRRGIKYNNHQTIQSNTNYLSY